jgi:hypothetical protein
MPKQFLYTLAAAWFLVPTLRAQQEGQKKVEPPKKANYLKVTGELTAKDPFDQMRPGCHSKAYPFEMKEGVPYVIDLIQLVDPKATKNIDPYLRLEDAKGTQLAEDDNSGGQPNAAIVFTPSKTATYQVIVTTAERGQTGKYLLEAQPWAGAVRPNRALFPRQGPVQQGNFGGNLKDSSPTDPNPKRKAFRHAVFIYAMNKGTKYTIGLNTSDFLPYLRLEDAAGKQLDEDFTVDGFQYTLINYQPKESGLYRLVVSSSNPGGAGYFNLYARPYYSGERDPVKQPRSLTPGGALEKLDKMDPLRPGRHYKVHTFKTSAGTRYAITMTTPAPGIAPGFGGYMRLEDEDGTILKKDEDPEDVARPFFVYQAEKTGMVKLVVSSAEAGKTGFYTLEIRPLGTTEAAPKKQFNSIQGAYSQFTNTDPVDKIRKGCFQKVHLFRMKAGLKLKYVVDIAGQQNNLDTCLRLEDSAGKILAKDDLTEGNDDPRIVYMPKETATYRIVVLTERPGATGGYQFNVRPVADGEPLPTPPSMFGYNPPQTPPPRLFDKYAIAITPAPQPTVYSGGGHNEEGHGYVEYRFAVENRSETETHRVQLTMPRYRRMGMGWGHYLQALKRSVEVGPKTTAMLSLFQPDLAIASGFDLEVEIDGEVQRDNISLSGSGNNRNRGQRFTSMHGGGGGRNNPLHVLASWNQAQYLNNNNSKIASARPPGKRLTSGGSIYQFQGLPLDRQAWSTSWLGYSSFDGVILSGREFKELGAEVKNALWQYVECGGSLLLIGEGSRQGDLPPSWESHKVKRDSWTEYYPGFGQCLIIPNTRLRALTPDQWAVIGDMWDQGDRAWNHIRSATEAQREFPVVDNVGIPVRSLFVVMLVFAILIGPVNIRVLTRKKRRIWLLWTVPAFSLLTCILIVGFMFISEGWQAKARVGGMVFLDESSQRAASLSWLGLYTPMTPGDGLHFSQETEITPHVRQERWANVRFPRTMDWTNDQHLDSGWIAPRLPAHFMVRTGEKRLERILVRQEKDGITMTNTLKVPIKAIWLADMKGRVYSAEKIPEGREAVLKPSALKLRNEPGKTTNEPGKLRKLFTGVWWGLGTYCEFNPEHVLRPGCYLAILDGAPFLEKGLSNAQLRYEPTAVFGVMKEPLAGSN